MLSQRIEFHRRYPPPLDEAQGAPRVEEPPARPGWGFKVLIAIGIAPTPIVAAYEFLWVPLFRTNGSGWVVTILVMLLPSFLIGVVASFAYASVRLWRLGLVALVPLLVQFVGCAPAWTLPDLGERADFAFNRDGRLETIRRIEINELQPPEYEVSGFAQGRWTRIALPQESRNLSYGGSVLARRKDGETQVYFSRGSTISRSGFLYRSADTGRLAPDALGPGWPQFHVLSRQLEPGWYRVYVDD